MSASKAFSLALRPVRGANAALVAGLAVHAAQRDLIASNADSLALAAAHANMHARAIYAGEALVGFALYAQPGQAGRQDTYVLYRLMIAAGQQGQGYGRRALALLLDEMRARGAGRVVLYYVPANARARRLYADAGFTEVGLDADGEMMAERLLP